MTTMRKLFPVMMITILAIGTTLAAAPRASAEETRCVASIGARTVDNLRVPAGRTCVLNGTRVQGTIYVSRAATLRATNVRVIGNLQAENHERVTVTGSTFGGSIQPKQGGPVSVATTRVTGNIQVTTNRGQSFLRSNIVNQDIQVFSHRGGIAIVQNRVDGNLQCKGNVPAPTGGGNVVQGNKEDQCRRL